jgi:hypothetical protein
MIETGPSRAFTARYVICAKQTPLLKTVLGIHCRLKGSDSGCSVSNVKIKVETCVGNGPYSPSGSTILSA